VFYFERSGCWWTSNRCSLHGCVHRLRHFPLPVH
jgi:hypothetical protein